MVQSVWAWRTVTAIIVGSLTISAVAQEKRDFVADDIANVDEDFALQGEYMGYALLADSAGVSRRHVGLQVVALGGGKFDAVLYTGGLPGAGWNRRGRVQLSGMRNGGTLSLQNGPLTIRVDGRRAELSHDGKQSTSRIEKILRISPTLGAQRPSGAISLFDGTNTDLFKNGRMTEDGLLMVGADTKNAYRDFTLHLEFRLPYMPYDRGQRRSNSGVYLQSRYEVQILDSFGLEGKHNECGGLYRQRPPDLNMCYPPLRWQTYDITFTSAKFDDGGKKIGNARVTVRHNGELIHDNVELTNKTGAGKPEGPQPLVTRLQNHGNPVFFRNIWLIEHDREPTEVPFGGNWLAVYARHSRYSGGYRYVQDFRQMAHPRYSGYRHR